MDATCINHEDLPYHTHLSSTSISNNVLHFLHEHTLQQYSWPTEVFRKKIDPSPSATYIRTKRKKDLYQLTCIDQLALHPTASRTQEIRITVAVAMLSHTHTHHDSWHVLP